MNILFVSTFLSMQSGGPIDPKYSSFGADAAAQAAKAAQNAKGAFANKTAKQGRAKAAVVRIVKKVAHNTGLLSNRSIQQAKTSKTSRAASAPAGSSKFVSPQEGRKLLALLESLEAGASIGADFKEMAQKMGLEESGRLVPKGALKADYENAKKDLKEAINDPRRSAQVGPLMQALGGEVQKLVAASRLEEVSFFDQSQIGLARSYLAIAQQFAEKKVNDEDPLVQDALEDMHFLELPKSIQDKGELADVISAMTKALKALEDKGQVVLAVDAPREVEQFKEAAQDLKNVLNYYVTEAFGK